MKTVFYLAAVMVLFFSCGEEKTLALEEKLNYCVEKVRKTASSLGDENLLPRNIDKDKTEWNTVGVRDWTSGFWPGLLWYAYEYSGDKALKLQAEKFTAPLEIIANSPARDHDIGFMVFCSYENAYRLTGNDAYKKVILAAADTLATLYDPIVGTIHSWPQKEEYPHNTIIDNMMNLELLFWASKNGGGQNLYDIALNHAETCRTALIRPDFTTYHLGVFDTLDGHFIRGVAHQGYNDGSMWARGQAWGIYGYAMSYRETEKNEFLETSKKLAKVFIKRLPEDGIPFWDFDDPAIPNAPKDASSAAIAACGMLELSTLIDDNASKVFFKEAAINLLKKLSTKQYLSGETNLAMLLHSTGHHPKGTEIDVPIIYADYYYMKALLKLKAIEENKSKQ